jgi:hypothetical protein
MTLKKQAVDTVGSKENINIINTTRRPGFAPRSLRVGFEVHNVALGQVFIRIIRFPPVNIIPPRLTVITYHYLRDEQ